jgi:type VI secretion system secreted protein VgrG
VLPGAADKDKAGSLMDQALLNASEEKIKRKPKRMLNFSG